VKYYATPGSYNPPEPVGYRHKPSGAVFWKSKGGNSYCFHPSDGFCGSVTMFSSMATSPDTYEPIYGSITITITNED
jgi:hypothetical protein